MRYTSCRSVGLARLGAVLTALYRPFTLADTHRFMIIGSAAMRAILSVTLGPKHNYSLRR